MKYKRKELIKQSILIIRTQKDLTDKYSFDNYNQSLEISRSIFLLGIINLDKRKLLDEIIYRFYEKS